MFWQLSPFCIKAQSDVRIIIYKPKRFKKCKLTKLKL